MAVQLASWISGKTLDVYYMDSAGHWWNGSAAEAYNAAHWANYRNDAAEQGASGMYATTVPALPAGDYVVQFRERQSGTAAVSDPMVGLADLSWSGSAELTALSLDLLLTSTPIALSISDPVAADGSITLVAGDDYLAADGRGLTWSSSQWPDLSGATIQLSAKKASNVIVAGSATFTAAGTVTSNSNPRAVSIDLVAATTAGLSVGAFTYNFEIIATLGSGHRVTLVMGTITVKSI